jgi:hypothetical protein
MRKAGSIEKGGEKEWVAETWVVDDERGIADDEERVGLIPDKFTNGLFK